MHSVSSFTESPNSCLRFTRILSRAYFIFHFWQLLLTLENSSPFLRAPLARAMRTNHLHAVPEFSTTPVWPGLPSGFQSSCVRRGLTNDAQPGLWLKACRVFFPHPPPETEWQNDGKAHWPWSASHITHRAGGQLAKALKTPFLPPISSSPSLRALSKVFLSKRRVVPCLRPPPSLPVVT